MKTTRLEKYEIYLLASDITDFLRSMYPELPVGVTIRDVSPKFEYGRDLSEEAIRTPPLLGITFTAEKAVAGGKMTEADLMAGHGKEPCA